MVPMKELEIGKSVWCFYGLGRVVSVGNNGAWIAVPLPFVVLEFCKAQEIFLTRPEVEEHLKIMGARNDQDAPPGGIKT